MSSYSLLFTKVQKDGGLFTIFEQNAKGQDGDKSKMDGHKRRPLHYRKISKEVS